MRKLAYIILIECYADWELGFLAPMFHEEGSADGASPLEFTEAVLKTLQVLPDEEIDGWRESFRVGEKEYWGG